MEQIKLNGITKNDNKISFQFFVTDGLVPYFSEKSFEIEYPENIESVPDAVAAVPFVCNVLPIVWLTDSVLCVKELDQAFYDCIPNVRKGYETMFPESTFAGKIEVEKIVVCANPATGASAAFFSGGLDAVNTLVNHIEERPALISIWGSDIRYENADGWKIVHRGISEYAQKYALPDVVIRSAFREFDKENALHARFHEQLKDGWWHGVKHGIGLLGHAAPYAYLYGLSTVYIASTNCPTDGPVRCASDPLTDNQVRFANARVIHDGFEFSRQDKVRNVVDYVMRTGDQVSLHVCWESQTGSNCCRCEKCYRTMAGLIAEGADPVKYGFDAARESMPQMRDRLVKSKQMSPVLAKTQWRYIGDRIKANQTIVRKHPYWKYVKWMIKADFLHPETLYISRKKKIRRYLAQFKFYQQLHKLKEKL